MTNPFAALDATAQAALVRSGDATPLELVAAAIAAAESLDPRLNAIIHPRYEAALAESADVDRSAPFAGVPMVIKDLDGTMAGEPYHAGTVHLRDAGYFATSTSWLIERFQAAGFIIIGRTNTPEFGLVPTTEPLSYGATRNPWNPEFSTGGSSGGSAAAVAAGIVAVGHAGDGGGSIRIPASECGLVGLKPTRGRITLGPDETESWGGLVARLAVTRSVRDTAALLDAVAGPGVGDPYWAPPPRRPYLDELGAPRRLRIGMTTATADSVPVHEECRSAVERTCAILRDLGHDIVDAAPSQINDEGFFAEMSGHFLTAFPVWVSQSVDDIGRRTGTEVTEAGVEPLTWSLAAAGREVGGVAFADAVSGLQRLSRDVQSWWAEGFDILVTPTLPDPPPRLGHFDAQPDNPLAGMFEATRVVSFTMAFNITGQPAISLPLGHSDGLPVGVQLVGAAGREDLLMGVASQLEAAAPWQDRHPAIWAG